MTVLYAAALFGLGVAFGAIIVGRMLESHAANNGARCECGHWLQPSKPGWRCVTGCTYQAERDRKRFPASEPNDG